MKILVSREEFKLIVISIIVVAISGALGILWFMNCFSLGFGSVPDWCQSRLLGFIALVPTLIFFIIPNFGNFEIALIAFFVIWFVIIFLFIKTVLNRSKIKGLFLSILWIVTIYSIIKFFDVLFRLFGNK